MKLKEILGTENSIILVDGCAHASQQRTSIGYDIYDCIDFSHIDCELLLKCKDELSGLMDILSHSNTFTIPELTEERGKLVHILGDKIKYIHGRKSPKGKRRMEANCKPRELIQEVQDLAYQLFLKSRDREIQRHQEQLGITIDDMKYKKLVEMVIILSRELSLKQDTQFKYGQHDHDMSKESDTDEKLVAMLYYNSMFSDKKPILVSGDSDFKSLLRVTPGLIGAREFAPDNSIFEQSLKNNPFFYYHKEGEDHYKKFIDGTEINFHPRFDAKKNEKKNEFNKRKIWLLWRELSGAYQEAISA